MYTKNYLKTNYKKTIGTFILTLLLCGLLFAGCSGNDGSPGQEESLTGSSSEILQQIIDAAAETLGEDNPMPQTFTDSITSENTEGMLGLSAEEFDNFVSEATAATGALITNAFEIAVVKCKDPSAASEAKSIISSTFNSGKWICVFPEQSLVMDAGSYILLAVGATAETTALSAAFNELSGGKASEADIFYEQGDPAGGGLMPIPLGSEGDETLPEN